MGYRNQVSIRYSDAGHGDFRYSSKGQPFPTWHSNELSNGSLICRQSSKQNTIMKNLFSLNSFFSFLGFAFLEQIEIMTAKMLINIKFHYFSAQRVTQSGNNMSQSLAAWKTNFLWGSVGIQHVTNKIIQTSMTIECCGRGNQQKCQKHAFKNIRSVCINKEKETEFFLNIIFIY